MMRGGSLNPQGFFDYPGLAIYVQLVVSVVRFLAGAIAGQWSSLAQVERRRLLSVGPRRHGDLRRRDGAAGLSDRHALGRSACAAGGRAAGRHAAARPVLALRADRYAADLLRDADLPAVAGRSRAQYRARLRGGRRRSRAGGGDEIQRRHRADHAAARLLDDGPGAVPRGSTTALATIAASAVAFLVAAPYTSWICPGSSTRSRGWPSEYRVTPAGVRLDRVSQAAAAARVSVAGAAARGAAAWDSGSSVSFAARAASAGRSPSSSRWCTSG